MSGQKLPVKLSSVVNASRYVPNTSSSSLIVAVRVRPLLKAENAKAGKKDIMRVIDGRVVVVLDPDESKEYLDVVQNRTKEKRYTFDVAFSPEATNQDVYDGTIRDLVVGVLYGINTTVFAYGATGSGKTYTMVGGPSDPGLMILSLQRIFIEKDRLFADEDFDVSCSYCEVYNEVIYDLLVKNSGPLELREDPDLGVQVAGLKGITVKSADDILDLLEEGNRRRKTEATDANAQSSRSHAVLEITIKRTPRNHYRVQQLRAKLSLVDLAGSERAADTNNAGQKLRDGANINRSLLALANCINALGKLCASANKAASYVPYRNSKLTRLLKDGLSGNSRTAMITTVSAAADQYHHSIGTLKYADRAKEIKTHVVQNVGTVESHISDYQRIIDNLQNEVQDLKVQLADRPKIVPGSAPNSENEVLALIDTLVQEMNDNIEERINLQKALFEIEDANIYNKYELKQLDDFLEAGQGSVKDITEARDRRADVLLVVKENDRERDKYKAEISENEEDRRSIQSKIDQLANTNQNVAFLNLMSTFRLQAVRLQEVKFQMAVRDQIISEQREVIANLWKILDKSGIGRTRVLDIAKQEGIIMDGFFPFSEEPTRGPTPPSSNGPLGGRNGSVANGAGGPGKHRIAIGQPGANVVAHDVATPNASLAGNRAKMRYRFWAQYQGSDDEVAEEGPTGPSPHVHVGPPPLHQPESFAHREKGARKRPPKKPAGPGSAHDRPEPPGSPHGSDKKGGAAGRRKAEERRGAAAGPSGRGAAAQDDDRAGGPRERRRKAAHASDQVQGDAGRPPLYGNGTKPGAYRAMANGASDKNATVPTVRLGRRAGQPSSQGTPDKGYSFELPRSQYDKEPSSSRSPAESTGHTRRLTEAWANTERANAAADAAVHAPLRPHAVQQQAALNDRLAKLKLRLGRRTEENGAAGPALAPKAGARPATDGEIDDRLPAVPEDALDQFSRGASAGGSKGLL